LRREAASAIPDKVADALRGRRVALVGFLADGADAMCAALAEVEARPRLFEATDGPQCHPVQECDVVVVHVGPQSLHSAWLSESDAAPAMRLVLAGERRDLLELPSSVLNRDVELLAAPWHVEEVLLRLYRAISRRTHDAPSSPAEEAGQPKAGSVSAPLRPKVVLADDDGIVLTVVGSTLQNYGMTCETASNGKDALRLIRETKPHVAVLDVNMPGHDGYEVLSAVRSENLPVSVILLTARQREGDILRGFQLGADDYLVKPFNPLELMARMKRLLRR
jgi:CheY-like chemotaxis protein